MGALANTRWWVSLAKLDYSIKMANSLGDLNFKKFGVTPEPEIRTKLLDGAH